ncbi:agaA33 [Symbiodinium sp. CCMP2592]|nr:agaA33 [Symbiodinium sp. CCMP2592]
MLPDAPVNSTFRWLLTSTFAQGGQYRLCWCADGQVCSTMEHFTVDVGAFSLLGPMPIQQAFTCVAGRECNIDPITGFHLDENWLCWRPVWPWLLAVQPPGYRLCWCADLVMKPINESNHTSRGCGIFSDYTYDIGSLSILGPMPPVQSRTCVSGHNCQLDGFTGHGLSNLDKLLVLDTCGEPTAMVPRWSLAGGSVETTSNGTAVSWQAIVSAAGGQYRLCWCAAMPVNETLAGQFCTHAGDFYRGHGCHVAPWSDAVVARPDVHQRADLLIKRHGGYDRGWDSWKGFPRVDSVVRYGSLGRTLDLRPSRSIRRESGHLCRLSAGIEHANSSDSVGLRYEVLAMDTCGGVSVPGGFPLQWSSNSSWNATARSLLSASMQELTTAPGGTYRLCWCGIPETASGCRLPADFRVHVGELTLIGPRPSSHTCISGRLCSLEDLQGLHLSGSNMYMVLDTCGEAVWAWPEGYAGLVQPGIAIPEETATLAGQCQLCWCASLDVVHANGTENPNASFPCRRAEDCASSSGTFTILGRRPVHQLGHRSPLLVSDASRFVSTAGSLYLRGPAPLQQPFTCLAGQRCSLENLSGCGMSDAGVLLVMDTCGIASTTLQFAPGGPEGLLSDYVLLTDASYRLCWFALLGSSNSSGCDLPASFLTDAGTMHIIGPAPLQQQYTCVSGQTCTL